MVADFAEECSVPVVVDPVMISSSGRRLLDVRFSCRRPPIVAQDGAEKVLRDRLLQSCTVATPNVHEAEALLGRTIQSVDEAARAATDLASAFGCAFVVKGGHLTAQAEVVDVVAATSSETIRLACRRRREVGDNDDGGAHGTGCVLSSALAARLALGDTLLDAVVGAKAACSQGIAEAVVVGDGPPVVAPPAAWPSSTSYRYVPSLGHHRARFPRLEGPPMRLYALADSSRRARALFENGVRDVQLRVKSSRADLAAQAEPSAAAARAAGGRLWINDDWRVARDCGAFGVHLGQEDLQEVEDLEELAASGLRLGVSTHCLSELAVATALQPSYVAFGPVFGTTSKRVPFDARGPAMVADWRRLVPPDTPLITIGGINLANAPSVLAAGADSIAVISVRSRPALALDSSKQNRRTAGNPRRPRQLTHCRRGLGRPALALVAMRTRGRADISTISYLSIDSVRAALP